MAPRVAKVCYPISGGWRRTGQPISRQWHVRVQGALLCVGLSAALSYKCHPGLAHPVTATVSSWCEEPSCLWASATVSNANIADERASQTVTDPRGSFLLQDNHCCNLLFRSDISVFKYLTVTSHESLTVNILWSTEEEWGYGHEYVLVVWTLRVIRMSAVQIPCSAEWFYWRANQ